MEMKDFSLEGKVALVTGASYGIGFAIAEGMAKAGATIVFNDIRQELVDKGLAAYKEAGVEAHGYVCDVTDEDAVQAMVKQIAQEVGVVDILVNNAGIAGQCLFQELTDARWHEFFAVNVDGAFYTSRAVLPSMLHEHEGCIVNVSSIWGQRGASCEVTYSCTKAALIGLTRSLASELAPTHIRVNCIAPGVIKTDMLDALPPEVLPQLAEETPLRRLGTPEDIAHAAAFLASEKADFITGQVLTVDGGFIL